MQFIRGLFQSNGNIDATEGSFAAKAPEEQIPEDMQLLDLPQELTISIGLFSENSRILETSIFFYKHRSEIVQPLFMEVYKTYLEAGILPLKIKEKFEAECDRIDYYTLLKELFSLLQREYKLELADVNFFASSFWREVQTQIQDSKDADLVFFWSLLCKSIPFLQTAEEVSALRALIQDDPFPIEAISDLKLTALSSSRQRRKGLPDEIKCFIQLEVLKIDGIGISRITESIVHLKKLQSLDLSYNNISDFPECITQVTTLKTLILSGNSISTVPDSIANLHNLEILVLSETNIVELPESLGLLKNLKELNLLGNQMRRIPDCVKNIPGLIIKLNSLDREGI